MTTTFSSLYRRGEEASEIARTTGWDVPTWDNLLAKLMLIVTEAEEADAEEDADGIVVELADVVIRMLDVVHTLDRSDYGDRCAPPSTIMPVEKDIGKAVRQRLVLATEQYRRGEDAEVLATLWSVIAAVDLWCDRMGLGLWVAVDLKNHANRQRGKLHNKKRSIG